MPLNKILKELSRAPELVWRDVEANTRRVTGWLVQQGKLSSEDAKATLAAFSEKQRDVAQNLEETLDRIVKQRISEIKPPQREELGALRHKINDLIDRTEQLETRLRAKFSRGEQQ